MTGLLQSVSNSDTDSTSDSEVRESLALVGISAAIHWGMPVPPVFQGNRSIMLSPVADEDKRPRYQGVDGHRLLLPREHLRNVKGHFVTSPERTWVDCAALIGEEHLVAMGDWALSADMVTIDSLRQVVSWAAGRRGVRRARAMVEHLRVGSESPGESRLRWHLVNAGLPEPEVNPTIVVRGVRVARLDLAYRHYRLAIEYDGDWHSESVTRDLQRRDDLEKVGWRILVAHKEDLEHPGPFVARVRHQVEALESRRRLRW